MAGSWCWERPTTNSGRRSDGVAAVVAAGSICRKRGTKRKASQQHDPFDDDWTTRCWCWAPPNINSDINGIALAVAASTSTGRRKKRKGSEQSRDSRNIIPSKHNANIGRHNNNNFTDINEDEDTDEFVGSRGDHDDDDNYDETDSDYDSVHDDDERVSDNSGKNFSW